MDRYLTELIGTFFLVLTIGCVSLEPAGGISPPLAVAAVLTAVIYAGGHISRAHYNPAVTAAFFLRGALPRSDIAPYIAAQIAGALLAVGVALELKPGAAAAPLVVGVAPLIIAEFLFTFVMVFVILNVATTKGTSGNSFYGIAISSAVLAGALSVGEISGSVLNPAAALARCLLGLSPWSSLGLYSAAHFGAAVAAVGAFNAVTRAERR